MRTKTQFGAPCMNAFLELQAQIAALPPPPSATEGERRTWDLDDRFGHERNFRRKCFRKLPTRFQAPVAETYRALYAAGGNFGANRYLDDIAEAVTMALSSCGADRRG
jgi:hypothetical protein